MPPTRTNKKKSQVAQPKGRPFQTNSLASPRSTRSKKIFSPWEFYHVTPTFNFEEKVKQTLDKIHLNEDEESENLSEHTLESSPLTTPENSPPSSPYIGPVLPPLEPPPLSTSISPLPSPEPPPPAATSSEAQDLPMPDGPQKDLDRRKDRRKANRRASRNRKREQAGLAFEKYQLREAIQERYIRDSDKHHCAVNVEDFKVSGGAFVAPNDKRGTKRVYRIDELTGPNSEMGFTLLPWDGIKPTLLLAKNRRLIGILAGNPGDADWPEVAEKAAHALETRRGRCDFGNGSKEHRRGTFPTLACGVSHGGGQPWPMNVHNNPQNQKVLDELNVMRCFRRISGFLTSVVATRIPKLYAYYSRRLSALYRKDTRLRRPFPFSIFARTTYNLGLDTVCYQHTDSANLTYGVCSITSLGQFNPKTGGHLVLWDYRLVVEFPPGSTILIPSAVVAHSNTAISESERRYSFTQYAAGALFRWVENDFQPAKTFRKSLTPEKLQEELEKDKRRWMEGTSLLPIVD